MGDRFFDVSEHVYAHRGLWSGLGGGDIPENSIAAFRAAADAGIGVELDVRVTRDGALVVFHDQTLARMCGDSARLGELTLAELEQRRLPDGSQVPTLEAVLVEMGQQPVLIEIKVDEPASALAFFAADEVASLIGSVPCVATVMSFDEDTVARLCRLITDRPIGLLIDTLEKLGADHVIQKAETARVMGCDYLGPHFTSLETVWGAAGGLPLVTWTVRDGEALALAKRHSAGPIFEGFSPALAKSGGSPI